MKSSAFVVPIADLERGPKQVTWPITAAWLERALEGTEASPGEQPGELDVELTKTGSEVMIRGQLSAFVTMPCARTQEAVPIDVSSEVFLLLAPAPAAATSPRRPRREGRKGGAPDGKGGKPEAASAKTTKDRHGKVRGAGWAADPVLGDEDAARDTYSGEEVVLDSFVREFILLELPMFPIQKGLPFDEPVTIAGSSAEAPAERPLDPRLQPLAELKSRLESKE